MSVKEDIIIDIPSSKKSSSNFSGFDIGKKAVASISNKDSKHADNVDKKDKDDIEKIAEIEKIAKKFDINEKQRDSKLIDIYNNIVKETMLPIDFQAKEAIVELGIKQINNNISKMAEEMAGVITGEILKNDAIELKGNPLFEEKKNEQKEEMIYDISHLSPQEIQDKYPFIKSLDYSSFKMTSLPIEEDRLIDSFFKKSMTFLNLPHNKTQIINFTESMLSKEVDVFIEDIARF